MNFSVLQTTAAWAEERALSAEALPVCGSTNDVAKLWIESQLAKSTPKFTPHFGLQKLIVTAHQTSGRGRGNHTWDLPDSDTGLLSSWIFRLPEVPAPVTSIRFGLALITAAQATFSSLSWALKAPNDLLLGQQKCAGILIEGIQQGAQNWMIFGLGLNVWSAPSLATATSLNHAGAVGLSASVWRQFLERLHLEIQLVLRSVSETELSLAEQSQLLFFLQKNPHLRESLTRVHSNGDLQFGTKINSWINL